MYIEKALQTLQPVFHNDDQNRSLQQLSPCHSDTIFNRSLWIFLTRWLQYCITNDRIKEVYYSYNFFPWIPKNTIFLPGYREEHCTSSAITSPAIIVKCQCCFYNILRFEEDKFLLRNFLSHRRKQVYISTSSNYIASKKDLTFRIPVSFHVAIMPSMYE